MNYKLLSLLLFPLLIVQGKRVRKNTPKLKEAEGKRTGRTGQGIPLKLLILGDSAAAGVGVEKQESALLGRIIEGLMKDHDVSWHLEASTGSDSFDLSQQINQLSALKSAKYINADAVVISIGVNDVTNLTSTTNWKANLKASIEVLHTKLNANQIYFSKLPPMHLFPALPNPLRFVLGERAKQLDACLKKLINSQDRCTYIDAPFSIDKNSIAEDGFHPGQSAYEVWGSHVVELIMGDNAQRLWNSKKNLRSN